MKMEKLFNKKIELNVQFFCFYMVQVKGLEPPRIYPLDPKSNASTSSAIPANKKMVDLVGLEPTTARL